jgi:arsenate reductase
MPAPQPTPHELSIMAERSSTLANNVAGKLNVLFLCTGNSARSQIAEALLATRGKGRFVAMSAGTAPAPAINPLALEVLRELGINWTGHAPKNIDDVSAEQWDIVITLCDHAKESCPVFPNAPVMVHWGMDDPAAVQGTNAKRRLAFRRAALILERRVEFLVSLPSEVGINRDGLRHNFRVASAH